MPTTVTLTDLRLSLPVPDGWEVLTAGSALTPSPEGRPVLLAPREWGGGFRPTLTVVGAPVLPRHPATPHRAGTDAMSLVLAEQDTHLAAYDLWPGGRRLVWLTWVGAEELVQEQWVLVLADRVVTLTATVDAERWSRLAPVLRAVADGVVVEGEPAAEMAYSPRWRRAQRSGGAEEPARDPDLVALGENLEDLGRVARHQRFRPSGVTVDREGLARWLRGEEEAGVVHDDLVAVGLTGADGVTTDAGRRVRTIVGEADRVITVEAAVGLLPLSLQLYRRGGDAIVVCTDGVSQWLGEDPHGWSLGEVPTRVHLIDVPTVAALGVLVSWLGVSPAWSLAPARDEVSRDALLSRVHDRSAPVPDGADAALRQVWRRLGALVTLRAEGPQGALGGMVLADAADRGMYQVLAPEESGDQAGGAAVVRLAPLPSAAFLDELVRLVVDPEEER